MVIDKNGNVSADRFESLKDRLLFTLMLSMLVRQRCSTRPTRLWLGWGLTLRSFLSAAHQPLLDHYDEDFQISVKVSIKRAEEPLGRVSEGLTKEYSETQIIP